MSWIAERLRFLLVMPLLLAACAQGPLQAPSAPPTRVQTALTAFRAEGKLAWNQNGKGDSARYIWTYREPRQHITLLTPLGSTAATLEASPGRAVLDTADGQHLTATSLEALSTRIFDLTLPLDGIEYWVQGVPVPGVPYAEEALPEGRRLIQRGYTLDYLNWTEVDGYRLPQQVDIRGGDLTLKLRIRQWTPNPTNP